jgi:hypothetical protein
MIGRGWRFFTHPLARTAAVIGVVLMAFVCVSTVAGVMVLFVDQPPGAEASILDEGGDLFRQALAVAAGAALLSLTPGLLVLAGAILIECAVRFARAASVPGRPGVSGFFTHGAARFIAIAALLYLPLWLALYGFETAIGGGPSLVAFMPPGLVFATLLAFLAVLIEYLSRIAAALVTPGALGVDEGAGG